MMGADAHYEVDKIGVFKPKMLDVASLGPGEVGFITAQIKQVADTRVGDTITEDKKQCDAPLPGFKPAQPVVFCGLFPVDAAEFEDLRAAIGKLRLNDASFSYEMETSAALGFGFRCGFLACCISRSFKSVCAASSISTSSRRRRPSSIRSS